MIITSPNKRSLQHYEYSPLNKENFMSKSPLLTLFISSFMMFLTSCASIPLNEKAGVEIGTLYKFSNPKLDSTLYVKFLPVNENGSPLLFATKPNNIKVKDISLGEDGVFEKNYYGVDDRGRVLFRFRQKGLFKDLLPSHRYIRSGQQNGDISSFSYRLDFKNSQIVN